MEADAFLRMHALDAEFLLLEDDRSPLHIGSACIFEGPAPSQGDCEQLVESRLALLPVYRKRVRFLPLGLGRPVWVDDPHFDLTYHVRRTALAAPHDHAALCARLGAIMSRPLDRSRPLWEMYIVEDLEHDRWALITKVHHALVDGIAGIGLVAAMLDLQAEFSRAQPAAWSPAPAPSARTLVRDAWTGLRADAAAWGRELARALQEPTRAAAHSGAIALGLARYVRKLVPAPRFSLQGAVSGQRGYACVRVKLDDVRTVGHAFGCKVNDVVLAILSGGYRAMLEHRGDDLARVRLRSLVPVSVRAPDARGELGNRVSAIFLELPVTPGDPKARLDRIAADMRRSKASHMIEAGVWFTELADLGFPLLVGSFSRLVTRVMHRLPQRALATVTTNVPGPALPLYLMGRRMLYWLPYVPIAQGARLGTAVLSYAGELAIGVTADEASVHDLDVFTRAVDADLTRLLERASAIQSQPRAAT